MIEGMDELQVKLKGLASGTQKMGMNAARNAIKHVQARVKQNCPVNEGELRNSIQTLTRRSADGVHAICYTNKEYAECVENGTGPVGAKKHEGISPDANPVYKTRGWAFPVSAITSGDYHFPKRVYDGQEYYLTSGQPAQPFLYPALKDGENEVLTAMARSARIAIGKEIND